MYCIIYRHVRYDAKFNQRSDAQQFGKNGFTNATDAADYLVNHGVAFRDAHGIIGRIVLYCLDKKSPIDDMSLEELKAISPVFEEDVYDAISMETCVNKRLTSARRGNGKSREILEKSWLRQKNRGRLCKDRDTGCI